MELTVVSYQDLLNPANSSLGSVVESALFNVGIIGVCNVPCYQETVQTYLDAARQFAAMDESIKQQYAPHRDSGDTAGYELGAEWFQDNEGKWCIDDKKASYYATIPDHPSNKWPKEIQLKTAYLNVGELIFETGKHVMNFIGLNDSLGISHANLTGYGRMLHYHQENNSSLTATKWCGAHFDHSVFTGLLPAYYFQNGKAVEEPNDAGLYIKPTQRKSFEKVVAPNQSLIFFQVGEFGQLASNDQICATEHFVQKPPLRSIERFTFALFYGIPRDAVIRSRSVLTQDARYKDNMAADGSIQFGDWSKASFERYRAVVKKSG